MILFLERALSLFFGEIKCGKRMIDGVDSILEFKDLGLSVLEFCYFVRKLNLELLDFLLVL